MTGRFRAHTPCYILAFLAGNLSRPYMHACPKNALVFPVTGMYVLACVPHTVWVSVHIRRICTQTVFILFTHIYIEYCTYICMPVHYVSIHIESVPYYLLPLLLPHVHPCLCMPHPPILTPVPTTRYLCPHVKCHFHVCTSGGRSSGVRVFSCSSWHSLSVALTLCSMQ